MTRNNYFDKLIIWLFMLFMPFSVFSQQVCSGAGNTDVLPTKCFEIESILVNACSSNEGYDEMVRLRVGPNPLTLNTINTVVWPTVNSWLGWATYNTTTLNKLSSINSAIAAAGNCGRLIKLNPTDAAPAYSRILVITSTVFSTTAHDFTGLTDTLYVALQNNNSVTSGHFANTTTNTARTLIMRTSSCGDTVTHYGNLMIMQDQTPGSEDGSGVNFTYAGVPSYYNYGCALPNRPFSVDAGTTGSTYCSGNTVPLSGTISGAACFYWYPANRAAGSFSDSTSLITNFNIAPGFTGTVKLYLRANASCTFKLDSVSFTVGPSSGTITINALTDTVRCNKNGVSLTASTSNANPITWSTSGKGSYSSTVTTTTLYTPSVNDTVVVWFSVTQNQSCGIAKDSVRVRFTKSPSPLFVPSDSIFCVAQAGSTVSLNPVVAGGTFSGTGVSGTNFIVPSTPGTYPVKYIVALNGCTDSLTRSMVVNTPTSAAFSLSDTFVCLGTKTITVTPTNTGGTFSGVALVGNVFTPTIPGIFTISYVIGSGACKDSVGKRIYVSPQPDARFAASDSIFCLGDVAATFTPITPGGVFTGNHVSANTFTPLSVGPHTVKYVVTSLGCTDSTSRNMLVNAKPDASFAVSDSVFCIGDAGVTFVPTQTGGTFSGTGVTGNTFTPTAAGSFVVSYVLDNGNCKDSVTHTMTVNPKPDASFTISDTVLCEGDAPAALTPVNSGGVFSGGQVSGTKFTPTTSGLYPITYKLSNGGCVDSVTHYIRVAAKPNASFTYAPQKIMVNDTVQFTYTGNGANAYVWSFGDGGFASVANPSHSFANEQVFTTWLVVSSLDGCLDSTYQAITVEAEENLFVPNVFTPNGDSVNDRFVISHMGIHDFNLLIYNRWGGLVFESTNPDVTWDGKFAGEICVEGVYVYLITYKNAKQATKSLRGTVTLIR